MDGIQICSNALIRLGELPIQSFDDGTDKATTCKAVYPIKRDYMLASYPWRFSMEFMQLSRMTASPTAQWEYQFALPADRVQGGFPEVYSSEAVGARPIRDYKIVGNVLMTSSDEIWVKYQYQVDESLWPPYFTELMISVMKAELTLLISDNQGLDQQNRMEVYGTPTQGGQGGMVGQAMFLDSRDNGTIMVQDFSLINARFGGIH